MSTGVVTQAVAESTAGRLPRPSSGTLIKAVIVAALTAVLFSKTLFDMALDWWNEPAWSQGMLLPPLALYVAWINRQRTLSYAAAQDRRGLGLAGFACLLYLLGVCASEFFMMRVSFVVFLAGLVWTFWGMPRLRSLNFPFLLLLTMIPLPVMIYNSLTVPLQLLASDLATRIAQTFGTSVYRDGNIIQLAGTSLGVVEACSGLNSLSALIVGSVLLGFLVCTSLTSRILLISSAMPLAIGVNILRVAGTAMLADHNREFAEGFYHLFSGWLVFVAGFGILYGSARLLHGLFDRKAA